MTQWSVEIGLDSSVVEHLSRDAVVICHLRGTTMDSSVEEHQTGDAVVCEYRSGLFSGRAPDW